EDHLEGALEELHLALDEQEVARLEGAEQRLAGVPQPGANGPRPVAQLQLQEQVAVAVGAELLVDDQVDLLDAVAVGHLLHEAPGWGDGRGTHESVVRGPWSVAEDGRGGSLLRLLTTDCAAPSQGAAPRRPLSAGEKAHRVSGAPPNDS